MISQAIISKFVSEAFDTSLHAKRIASLSNAVEGCIKSCSLAIHAIGTGLAQAQGLNRKHAIKQVDRLLSNDNIHMEVLLVDWIHYVIGLEREEIIVSLDWTDFDADNHSTLVMSLQTSHSRNTPLLWKTYDKNTLKDHRNAYEDSLLNTLKESLLRDIKVTVVADRGFCDVHFFNYLNELGFDYIIRTRSNIYVYDEVGNTNQTLNLVPANSRIKTLKDVFLTHEKHPVKRVIITKKESMKEAWIIASSREDLLSSKILTIYSKRWGIESSFRDIKDYRFGMGMSSMHTKSAEKRDRLFLISALAIALLTLLGKAGDAIGMERSIKVNTRKSRSHSLWNQGCLYYSLLPTMKDRWLIPLMEKFYYYLEKFQLFKRVFSVI